MKKLVTFTVFLALLLASCQKSIVHPPDPPFDSTTNPQLAAQYELLFRSMLGEWKLKSFTDHNNIVYDDQCWQDTKFTLKGNFFGTNFPNSKLDQGLCVENSSKPAVQEFVTYFIINPNRFAKPDKVNFGGNICKIIQVDKTDFIFKQEWDPNRPDKLPFTYHWIK